MSETTTFVVARVDTLGQVTRTGDWFTLPRFVEGHDVALGNGPDLLLLFSPFTDSVRGREYWTLRLWGRFGAVPGIEEARSVELPMVELPTIVRGVLFSAESPSPSCLLDISGRRVQDLRPGANDVSRLSPGVYFVRRTSGEPTTKVVLAR